MSENAGPRLLAVPPDDKLDRRVPVTPESAVKLVEQGWAVCVPEHMGEAAGFSRDDYQTVGCELVSNVDDAIASANAVLCVSPPSENLITKLSPGTILAGFLDPFAEPGRIKQLADAGVVSLSLELVPRTTLAQSMDALSSQASLAGYAAVILAAERLAKALPMMSTPAGTIRPAKILVVGTGVAGLQAIATAVRLGARVTAYDVRPTAKEQVESLGAKFAKIDVGETEEAKGGYANELTAEQLDMQRKALAKLCSESDIIITTAQIFGRRAPLIVMRDMVEGMTPGAVIVDAAIATGGNVELTKVGQEIEHQGVKIIGDPFLASRVARDASAVLASNFVSLLKHTVNPATMQPEPDSDDEIVRGVLLTYGGEIRDERIRALLESSSEGNQS